MTQYLKFVMKLDFALERFEHQSNIALKWFEDKNMKINSGKCHVFVSGNKHEQMRAKIGDNKIWESKTVKLLVITIDNELKFDEHKKQCFHESTKETYGVDVKKNA